MRTLAAAPAAMLKAKKPTPKYCEMRCKAISALKEHRESSRQTILKYVMENFNVGKIAGGMYFPLMLALECGATKASLKQSKGKGAIGSFSIAEVAKPAKAMEPTKETRPAKATKPAKTAKPAKTTKRAKARRSAKGAV